MKSYQFGGYFLFFIIFILLNKWYGLENIYNIKCTRIIKISFETLHIKKG